MRFEALEVSVDMIRCLRQPLEVLRSRVAAAWGDLREPAIAESLRLLDRLLGMLWRLSHSTPRSKNTGW